MFRSPERNDKKTPPPAAGQFGLDPMSDVIEWRAYRPAGCPSVEQFEARFLLANDRASAPRAA